MQELQKSDISQFAMDKIVSKAEELNVTTVFELWESIQATSRAVLLDNSRFTTPKTQTRKLNSTTGKKANIN